MAMPTLDPNAPDFTRRYPNLADPDRKSVV